MIENRCWIRHCFRFSGLPVKAEGTGAIEPIRSGGPIPLLYGLVLLPDHLMIFVCWKGRRPNGHLHQSARREPANWNGMCYRALWRPLERSRRTPRSQRWLWSARLAPRRSRYGRRRWPTCSRRRRPITRRRSSTARLPSILAREQRRPPPPSIDVVLVIFPVLCVVAARRWRRCVSACPREW